MIRTALFIISGDPRTSARPAEGLRVAAGVGAWKKVAVTVYLRDAAILSLGEFVDELIDEDHFTRYLPMLAESGRPVYVQAGSPFLSELGESPILHEPLDDAGLAKLIASHDFLIRF